MPVTAQSDLVDTTPTSWVFRGGGGGGGGEGEHPENHSSFPTEKNSCVFDFRQNIYKLFAFAFETNSRTMTKGRLVGPVVEVFASRAADLGSIPAFGVDLFPGRVIPVI